MAKYQPRRSETGLATARQREAGTSLAVDNPAAIRYEHLRIQPELST